MSAKCSICRRPVNGAAICVACERAFERTVAEIPALADELDLTITRQTAMGSRNGSRATETSVAFNVQASVVADNLRLTIAAWARDFEDDSPNDDIATIGRFLLWKLSEIRQSQTVDQLVDEITYACRAAWRAVDRPANRSRIYVAECLELACCGDLIATIPTVDYDPTDETTHARITCSECQISFGAESWMHVGRRLLARAA